MRSIGWDDSTTWTRVELTSIALKQPTHCHQHLFPFVLLRGGKSHENFEWLLLVPLKNRDVTGWQYIDQLDEHHIKMGELDCCIGRTMDWRFWSLDDVDSTCIIGYAKLLRPG